MQNTQQILDAIPDGGSITFSDFAQKVGSVANSLAFASPQRLARAGHHLTITCEGAGSLSSSGVSIQTEQVVVCDISVSGDDLVLSNISGITISQGVASGALKKATITSLSNGHFRISGTVHVLFTNISFTREVDEKGQIID